MTNTGSDFTGLFSTPVPPRRGFPAFAISVVFHGVGFVAVMWAVLHTPAIIVDPVASRYKVRHLDLHLPDTPASRAAEALYPTRNVTPTPERHPKAPSSDAAAGQAAEKESAISAPPAIPLPVGGQGKLTLIQPQVRAHVDLRDAMPVPTVMMWLPEQKPTVKIVPPTPEKPSTTSAQTSVEVPNEEVNVSDMPLTATARPSPVQTPPAGNSTPIASKGAEDVHTPPATVSRSQIQPAPAPVLSASNLRMNDGTAILPPVNETRGQNQKDGAASGQQVRVLGAGDGGAAAKPGAGNTAAGSGAAQNGDTKATSTAPATSTGDAQQFGAGETAEHIQLPKDGKFGVVVVGTSLAEQYPETLAIWSDRVAYTAYLHVGTPKAWILQYAQLRSQDASAAGTVAHLVAPWPYDIMRPNLLAKDLNADALMIHGILNESGRLEKLAIAYPQGYIHASFVLNELSLWQFRPAQQQGKPTPVEVLLIIPEDDD